MKYRFQASENFWKTFYRLSPLQKASVRQTWQIFKNNPFNPRLGTHRINSLSARYKKVIYSTVVEADLRVVFYMEGNLILTIDVGTHSIYR